MNVEKLDLKDKTIKCQDCDQEFIFTVGEQRYFISKGLSLPKRCSACRVRRRDKIVRVGGER